MQMIKRVAGAMEKRRRELIGQPLARIWNDLAVTAIEVAADEIEPDFDVEWQMDWKEGRNIAKHPERYEIVFEKDRALAELLHKEVVFLNSFWWEKELPERIQGAISIAVQCSDVFAWACADAEPLPYDEIERLWRMWKKDEHWGPAVWCMLRRRQMPQKPVEDLIRKHGIWDLDSLNLNENTQDQWVQEQFRRFKSDKLREMIDAQHE